MSISKLKSVNYNLSNFQTSIYCIVDIETTGFDVKNNKIIEIAGVKIKNNKIIDKFQSLINTDSVQFPFHIKYLTGIKESELKEAPFIYHILPKFLKFIENCHLIAHNASFEYKFLRSVYEKNQLLNQDLELQLQSILCTNSLSWHFFKKSCKLEFLTKEFDIPTNQFHRALDDSW